MFARRQRLIVCFLYIVPAAFILFSVIAGRAHDGIRDTVHGSYCPRLVGVVGFCRSACWRLSMLEYSLQTRHSVHVCLSWRARMDCEANVDGKSKEKASCA